MRDVYLAGAGMTRFAKQPDRTLKELTEEAVLGAVEDAELSFAHLEVAFFGNAVAGSLTGQEMVLGQVSLRPLGIDCIPIFNIENACASSSSAFHLAWQGVAGGLYDAALVVGAEKMTHPDRARTFGALAGAVDVESFPLDGGAERSPFMDLYAEKARHYMETSGATIRDFAAVAVKNQYHGSLNPKAQYGAELDIETVLRSPEVVWPLTLLMCSPISDGAAAAVVVSRRLVRGRRQAIRVAASVVRSGVDPRKGSETSATVAAEAAYAAAGIGPQDIHCLELHDAAAPAELALYEELGLAAPGEGPALIRDGVTRLGGKLPVNTSGGLIARGHPIGATGLAQLVEIVQQLRGEAGPRQVPGARVGMAHNAGGWLQGDNAAVAVHIVVRE